MTKFDEFSRRNFLAGVAVAAGSALLPDDLLAEPHHAQLPLQPELVPERIILSLTADPAHSQAVTWRTDKGLSSAQAQIAPASANPNFEKAATTVSCGRGQCRGRQSAKPSANTQPTSRVNAQYALQLSRRRWHYLERVELIPHRQR